MNHLRAKLCAICGEERSANQIRFLVAENRWEDKLTILQWNEHMAARDGIQVACSVNHVEELVIHWMTTGSLDYPFARTSLGAGGWHCATWLGNRVDIRGGRRLGELAVHRDSLERALAENPESLRVILDALLDALRQEAASQAERISEREEPEEALCAAFPEREF
jgi:hypothetical protein